MKQKCHILRGIALPLVLAIGALPHWSSPQSSFTWNGGGGDNFWTTGGHRGGTAPGSLQNFLNFARTTRVNKTNNFSQRTRRYQIHFKDGTPALPANRHLLNC